MSQLESLLSLTRMQSERQLAELQQKKQFVAHLNRQLSELIEYSRFYQQSAVGTDNNLATLLVHRQQFISQLGAQIDELTHRVSKLTDAAAECATQWHYLEARQKAIESMYERKKHQDNYLREKVTQQNTDELARLGSSNGLDTVQRQGLYYA